MLGSTEFSVCIVVRNCVSCYRGASARIVTTAASALLDMVGTVAAKSHLVAAGLNEEEVSTVVAELAIQAIETLKKTNDIKGIMLY